jgi:hypothetical protein
MGRTVTPTYRVELTLASGCWRATPEAWRRHYGRPTVANLARFVAAHNASMAPGGANAHLSAEHAIIGATIVRQSTGQRVAEYYGRGDVSAPSALVDALRVLVDHASEIYPHFESERGQRDLAQARAALASNES